MSGGARPNKGELPRPDTARRAKAEGRPVAIQAALDAFEDGDTDSYVAFLLGQATLAEVEKHVSAFARATAMTETAFLRLYRERQGEFIAAASHPVSPTSPPPTGDGEDGERTSGTGPNRCTFSFGDNGVNGYTESTSRITLTPFCDLVAPPLPPEAYLFGDILIRGTVTLFSGAPGSGKSTFAYFVAGRLARDGEVLGRGPGTPIPVAYFDAESPASLAREKAMLATEAQHTRGLMKLSDNAFSDLEALIALLREHGVQLLIVDTLNRALPVENDNDSRDARERITRLQRIARDANVAVLAICHPPKAEHSTPVHNVRGSVETTAGADVVVIAKAAGPKGRFLALEVTKNRHAITTFGIDTLRLRKAGCGSFEIAEGSPTETPTKRRVVAEQIERWAREHGRITRQEALALGEKSDAAENTIERALSDLVEDGILGKLQRAVYEFVACDNGAAVPQ